MKIQLLRNAFRPNGSSSRTILKRGSIEDLPDDEAEVLIAKELAVEVEEASDPEKSSKELREAEVKAMTKDPLIALLAQYGLEDEKNNDDRKAKVLEVEFDGETQRTEEEINAYVASL